MAAIDACEPQIIQALEKDGWHIQRKSFRIPTTGKRLIADIVFERGSNGVRERIIVVEVKCFSNPDNDVSELYTAIGQYTVYLAALEENNIDLPLYLAVPDPAYRRIVEDAVFQRALLRIEAQFITIDLELEEVVSWIT